MVSDSHILFLELLGWVSYQMGSSFIDIFIALNGSVPLLIDFVRLMGFQWFIEEKVNQNRRFT